MNPINQLKSASNVKDVAHLLGFTAKTLSYIIYKIPNNQKYTSFPIDKRSGGTRIILAPIEQLKLLQRRLATHLQEILNRIEEEQIKDTACIISHGFKNDLSISTNAESHVNKRWVFNVDLEDFFPSINFGRVRGFFIKNKHFRLNPTTATILSQIICHDNQLPQGAPTSPVVSNLISGLLDIRLNKIASKNYCSYTRYADDLTFSTNKKFFPKSLAREKKRGEWEVAPRLFKEIKSSGFNINAKKTRLQYKVSRQDVTGLVVNKKVNIKNEKIKLMRTQVNNVIKNGNCYIQTKIDGKVVNSVISTSTLQGQLAFSGWVKGKDVNYQRINDHWKKESSFVKTYRKFLDFQTFANTPIPIIICEGKTDIIYLRCAIKKIEAAPDNLKNTDNPAILGVRLLNYTKTTSWIQRLGGGSGDLKNLISDYDERMKSIETTQFTAPVIIVVDNDQGTRKGKFNSLVKEKSGSKVKIDGSNEFYHVSKNLYVVYTPKIQGDEDTMIESFLPDDVLKQQLNGKTLELDEKKFDKSKNYGKAALAEHIVNRQKDHINFDAFLPLLTRISNAIEHYKDNS